MTNKVIDGIVQEFPMVLQKSKEELLKITDECLDLTENLAHKLGDTYAPDSIYDHLIEQYNKTTEELCELNPFSIYRGVATLSHLLQTGNNLNKLAQNVYDITRNVAHKLEEDSNVQLSTEVDVYFILSGRAYNRDGEVITNHPAHDIATYLDKVSDVSHNIAKQVKDLEYIMFNIVGHITDKHWM